MRKLTVIWSVGYSTPDLSAIWKLLRMTSILSIGLITVLVVSSSVPARAADGKDLALNGNGKGAHACSACHGVEGVHPANRLNTVEMRSRLEPNCQSDLGNRHRSVSQQLISAEFVVSRETRGAASPSPSGTGERSAFGSILQQQPNPTSRFFLRDDFRHIRRLV
jgi:hypothetical protein